MADVTQHAVTRSERPPPCETQAWLGRGAASHQMGGQCGLLDLVGVSGSRSGAGVGDSVQRGLSVAGWRWLSLHGSALAVYRIAPTLEAQSKPCPRLTVSVAKGLGTAGTGPRLPQAHVVVSCWCRLRSCFLVSLHPSGFFMRSGCW